VVVIKIRSVKISKRHNSIRENIMKAKIKKISNYNNFDDWVIDLMKQDSTGIDKFVETAFEEFAKDGDEKALLITLRQIAKAKGGFKLLANKTGLTRESLYRTLSSNGNPRLHTLAIVLSALGYGIFLKPLPNHR
jgi:probable addiction module antidote protein